MPIAHTLLLALLSSGAAELPEPIILGSGPNEIETPIATNDSCKTCHASDDKVLAFDSYRGSMMNLAGRDPIFLAAFEIARRDDADVAVLCGKCHFPAAFLDGRVSADTLNLRERDLDGVSCDVCHRMTVPPPLAEGDALSGLPPGNAQFFIAPFGGTKLGAYETDLVSGHASEASPLFEDSRLCGTCHDVTDVLLERMTPDGVGMDRAMPVERTFSEWAQSSFAVPGEGYATCQSCHMRKSGSDYKAAVNVSLDVEERKVSDHRIVGSGTIAPLMVAVLANEGGDPYLEGLAPILADTVVEAKRLLQEESALVEARGLIETSDGAGLRVRVENLTGHKLPTGYSEGRRMFLSSVARFEDGTCGPRTGVLDPRTCEMAPGEEPVKIWEILLGNPGSGASFHFAMVDSVLYDSRIPPAGFVPDADTASVGAAFEVLADGTQANWDDVVVPLGDGSRWPVIVDVRLMFQATTGDFLRFLVDGAPENGPELARLWEAAGGGPPVEMVTLHVAVHEDGTIEPAEAAADCQPTSFDDVPAGACLVSPDGVIPAGPASMCACTRFGDVPPAAMGLVLLLLGATLRRRPNARRGA